MTPALNLLCPPRQFHCFSPVSCVMSPSFPSKPLVDKVVIVGGGLGGLSAAIKLLNVGINAQVYERGGRLTGGEGTLISLFPNGCKCLLMGARFILLYRRFVKLVG